MASQEPVDISTAEMTLVALQPLKDLASNWDIDLGAFLEEYLDELKDQFSQDIFEADDALSSNNKLDPVKMFVRAGLILNNSARVYSQKVDFLYSLASRIQHDRGAVFDDHDNGDHGDPSGQSANKNRGRLLRRARRRKKDPALEAFESFDLDNPLFLDINDVIPETVDDPHNKFNARWTPPFLPFGKKPEHVYRFHFDKDGRYMVPPEMMHYITKWQDFGEYRLDETGESEYVVVPGNFWKDASGYGTLGIDTSGRAETVVAFHAGAYGDDDDGGGGFVMADDEPLGGDYPQSSGAGSPIDTKRVTFGNDTVHDIPSLEDPWATLDPNKPDRAHKPRPLKIGKTIRLPPGVSEPPSECVTGARTKKMSLQPLPLVPKAVVTVPCLATQTFHATVAARKRSFVDESSVAETSSSMPAVSLKGLAFGEEFAYIAKATAKRRAAERRASRMQATSKQLATVSDQDNVGPVDDDNDDGGFPVGGDDDDDDYGPGTLNFDDTGVGAFESDAVITGTARDGEFVGNSGIGSVDDIYGEIEDADGTPVEFDALVRAHIAAYKKSMEKWYFRETQLDKNVRLWEERIQPILDLEEERDVFDIQRYGDVVLHSIGSHLQRTKGKDGELTSIDFADVTRMRQQYEVCRIFLATLALTNAGNVTVSQESPCSPLNIELLDANVCLPAEMFMVPTGEENEVH